MAKLYIPTSQDYLHCYDNVETPNSFSVTIVANFYG